MAVFGADVADFEVVGGAVAEIDEFLDLGRAEWVGLGESQSRQYRVEDGADEHSRGHVGEESHYSRREGGVK